MAPAEIVGFGAGSLTAVCWFPQAIRTIRTGDVSAISLTAQGTFALGVILWAAYGVMIKSWPIIACNLVTLAPVLVIVVMKARSLARR